MTNPLYRNLNLIEVVDKNQSNGSWLVQNFGDSTRQWQVDPTMFQQQMVQVPDIFYALTPDQIEKLIHHAWELEGHRFTVASDVFAPATTPNPGGTV